tara:strand:+ start:1196 stop:1492 length:297 start_codon:yes stop_codon:yes gene_type:complete
LGVVGRTLVGLFSNRRVGGVEDTGYGYPAYGSTAAAKGEYNMMYQRAMYGGEPYLLSRGYYYSHMLLGWVKDDESPYSNTDGYDIPDTLLRLMGVPLK